MTSDPQDLAERLASSIAELDEARSEIARLRSSLARLVRYERSNPHSHEACARWDESNSPRIAGLPCARCHAFADARELLGCIGGARWLSRDEERLVDIGASRAEPYACTNPQCGCASQPHREEIR